MIVTSQALDLRYEIFCLERFEFAFAQDVGHRVEAAVHAILLQCLEENDLLVLLCIRTSLESILTERRKRRLIRFWIRKERLEELDAFFEILIESGEGNVYLVVRSIDREAETQLV